jgi:hypothetical protein
MILTLLILSLFHVKQQTEPVSLKFQDLTLNVELEETWNESGYFDKIHDDTISVRLGLVSNVSGQRYQLELSNDVSEIEVFQNYETSLTLMDEGPHVDLTEWKHYISQWKRLELEKDSFYTLKYSQTDFEKFPEVSTVEILEAIRDKLNVQDDKWTELAKQCKNARSYPCGVSISHINLRIELTKTDGSTSTKYIIFEVPMGC